MSIRDQVTALADEALRKSSLTYSMNVVRKIPDLFACVCVDQPKIAGILRDELNKGSRNPINALLHLMGLQIVSPNRLLSGLEKPLSVAEDYEVQPITSGADPSQFLQLDKSQLQVILAQMIRMLEEVEKETALARRTGQQQSYNLTAELEKARSEKDAALHEAESLRETIQAEAQRILGLCGPKGMDGDLAREAVLMLETLGLAASWEGPDRPERFRILYVEAPEQHRSQPCLLDRSGSVVRKGLYFTLPQAE